MNWNLASIIPICQFRISNKKGGKKDPKRINKFRNVCDIMSLESLSGLEGLGIRLTPNS